MKNYSNHGIPLPAYSGVLILGAVWLSSILAVPFWMRGGPAEKFTAGLIRYFFSPICHQMTERSFRLFDHSLGVCARCTGIYAGFFLGTVLFPFIKKPDGKQTFPLGILCIATLPAAAEWILFHLRVVESSNWVRCSTGLILGGASVFWVLPGVFQLAGIWNQTKG